MKDAKEKVLEIQSVIDDIVNEAQRKEISWEEALEEIKNEIAYDEEEN